MDSKDIGWERMEPFTAMYHAVEKLSAGQAAAAGGAGAGISIDVERRPAYRSRLRGLVVMKLVQQRRAMRLD
jgi:hypothetical protein